MLLLIFVLIFHSDAALLFGSLLDPTTSHRYDMSANGCEERIRQRTVQGILLLGSRLRTDRCSRHSWSHAAIHLSLKGLCVLLDRAYLPFNCTACSTVVASRLRDIGLEWSR
jgi:hypothetical protein